MQVSSRSIFLQRVIFVSLFTLCYTSTCLFAVHSAPQKIVPKLETEKKIPAVPSETVDSMDRKAKRAVIFSAIGVSLVMASVLVLSLGTLGTSIPLAVLGLASLAGNIGFVKAFRIRSRTQSRKRTYFKSRKRAKTALILSCVLGLTLIFGLLHMLLDPGVAM